MTWAGMTMPVKLSELIPPHFHQFYYDFMADRYTHYKQPGGRGSAKSSTDGILIPLKMTQHPNRNAVVLRRVGNTLRTSVVNQVLWGIEQLGMSHLWKFNQSTMEMTYLPTGQQIFFRGADDPQKIKSIKPKKGYIGIIWFEERAEFDGEDEERNILQSLMRGGEHTDVIYSWNPPISINSWVNQDVLGDPDDDTKIYHSTYLTMPREWLGEDFFIQAEKLKAKNITKYRHEYLGEATGTGGQVFYNLTLRKITSEEIARFDKIRQGLDFGFAADPLAYVRMHFDRKRMKLYIFDELYQVSLGTVKAVELLKKKNPENGIITADSEEPRSIASFNEMGLRLIGAKKGPGSVDYGMQYLSDDIEEIIIDPVRCPNAAREFSSYELEQDRNGNFKGTYPDKNNHTIDAARYALEADMARKRARIKDKKLAGFY